MFFSIYFSYTKYNGNAQPLYRKGILMIPVHLHSTRENTSENIPPACNGDVILMMNSSKPYVIKRTEYFGLR